MFADYEYETSVAFRRIRRVAILTLGVAFVHIVFGAIVRISGSGMGCGDNWPKCAGYWIPPMNRPELIVEVSHRYLASILSLLVVTLLVVAWRQREVVGIGGKSGPLATAAGAFGAVVATALLGSVTVRYQNAMWATVAHLVLAMTLLALLVMTIVRATTGPDDERRVSPKALRSAIAAAGLAAIVVAMGGVTAKYTGAPIGCLKFPWCGQNPAVSGAAVQIQVTHRVLAFFLIFHLVGVVMGLRKRRDEAPLMLKVASVALGLALLQLVVAAAMIGMKLPPIMRSMHQAVGVSIWIATSTLAYVAWVGSRPVVEAALAPMPPRTSGQRKTVARQSLSARELE